MALSNITSDRLAVPIHNNLSALIPPAPPIPHGFFNTIWGGVHLWIWLFMLVSMAMLLGVMLYVFREWLNFQWLSKTKPQKLVHIFLHHAGGMYSTYWRIVPLRQKFSIGAEKYYFSRDGIARQELQSIQDMEHQTFRYIIGNTTYEYNPEKLIKFRWNKFPELHYFAGNPNPIDWSQSYSTGTLSAVEETDMDDANLFVKLLSFSETKSMMMVLMMMVGVAILVGIVNALKLFNVLK